MATRGLINVAIIGGGHIGHWHARGVLNEPDYFRLKAACDIDRSALKTLSDHFGVSELYTDYRDILKRRDIDAVMILLPHDLHEQVSIEAAKAGKHVLVEKPIARRLEEANNMIHAAQNAGVTLMVAHNHRYRPTSKKIRELLNSNAIGEVFCARIDHHQNFNQPQGHWYRSKEAAGGGSLISSGVHRLDLLRWFLGEAKEVFAYQVEDPRRLEGEVATVATLKFRSGAIGEIMCNWGAYGAPLGEGISLFGKDGSLYLKDSKTLLLANPDKEKSELDLLQIKVDEQDESMWAHFAKCINSGSIPLTSGPEARSSLELVLAIYRSSEIGMPVKLPLN